MQKQKKTAQSIVDTLMSFKTEDDVPYFNPEFLKNKFDVTPTIK